MAFFSRPRPYPSTTRIECAKVDVDRETFISSFLLSSLFIGNRSISHGSSTSQNRNDTVDWTGTHLKIMSLDQAAALVKDPKDSIFTMAHWPDPILRQKSAKIKSTGFQSNELYAVAHALRRTAIHNHAVGLAAQQWCVFIEIILLYCVFSCFIYTSTHIYSSAIDASLVFINIPFSPLGLFMVNPIIISRSSEMDMTVWDETCLVLPPNFHAVLFRDAQVTVEYKDLEGDTQTITFHDAELARTVQHEMDHDRGILILDHIGLEEMQSDEMRQVEIEGHTKRMDMAFSRF